MASLIFFGLLQITSFKIESLNFCKTNLTCQGNLYQDNKHLLLHLFDIINVKSGDHKILADLHVISKKVSYHLNIELQKTLNLQIKT